MLGEIATNPGGSSLATIEITSLRMLAHGGGQGQDNHREIKLGSNESVPVACPTSEIFSHINH